MKYLAVIAGKGGVGKTTISLLLSRAFQRNKIKVGLIDADIYGPSVANYFIKGEWPKEINGGISAANYEEIKNISLGYFQQNSKKISHLVRAPIANAIIESFLHEVIWDDVDLCLVDFPPGTGDVPLTLMQSVPFSGAVIVTTADEMAKWDVEKGIEMVLSMQVPVLGIIENKSYLDVEGRKIPLYVGSAGKDLSEKFSLDLLGRLPCEPGILEKLQEKNKWHALQSPLLDQMGEIAVEISRKIWDNPTFDSQLQFAIEGGNLKVADGDRLIKEFSGKQLQQHCPCASCSRKKIEVDSEILSIEKVGNFGWKIRFSQGCSQGIYTDAFFTS